MPFSVNPSKRVDIDMSDAGPDDFLQLALKDGTQIYLRKHEDDWGPRLVFDEELLPRGFMMASLYAARNALNHLDMRRSGKLLQERYEDRPDPSVGLLQFVAQQLRSSAYVAPIKDSDSRRRNIDIGDIVEATFRDHAGGVSLEFLPRSWTAPSEIIEIEPIDRFRILVRQAANEKDV